MSNSARLGADASVTEPFDVAREDLIEGDPKGRVAWLRENISGIFEADASKYQHVWPSDETVIVLEGSVTVEIGDDRIELGPGDSASFKKGDKGIWHLHAPFREFFIYTK